MESASTRQTLMMPMLPAMEVTAVRPFLVNRFLPERRKAVQKDMLVLLRRFFACFLPCLPKAAAGCSSSAAA